MARNDDPPGAADARDISKQLRILVDSEWYLATYPDVRTSGAMPLDHYVRFGIQEGREPNGFFDGAWYRAHHPDVAASGINPLLHYLRSGAGELRNPHPRFDAAWYVEQHPEAAANPLLFHLSVGRTRGWATEPPFDPAKYGPSGSPPPACPAEVVVDVVVPVYRGLAETQRCLNSILADPDRPPGQIIVVDDATPEPALAAWLDALKAEGRVRLVRNRRNLGFVASVNRGIVAAAGHDVVLLNSDTEVPHGWLRRLAGHAYAGPRIASVSPFSNNATICGYPTLEGGPPAFGLDVGALDAVCRDVNGGRSVEVPTTVGFCMYIRRAALDAVGAFDAETFGRGYGEENDFCLRAAAQGWQHRLACDTYVFHEGNVSFGTDADAACARGQTQLVARWPDYPRRVAQHVRRDPAGPFRYALTAALFRRSGRPTILLVSHELGGGVRRHVEDLVAHVGDAANFLLLVSGARGVELTVPGLPRHPAVPLATESPNEVAAVLDGASVSRMHIHHLLGADLDIRALVHRLGVPFDLTVHDWYALCPQVNMLPWLDSQHCGEPGPAHCNACLADRPVQGAQDITSWRQRHAWLFLEAERVFCPSQDVRARLARHGLDGRAVFASHEAVVGGPWPLTVPKLGRGEKLRIAMIGVLAPQKGAATVAAVAEASDPAAFAFHLIGSPEQALPAPARRRIRVSGEYDDDDLPALIAAAKPHVVWFPAQWPETYSYTLSAAIAAGLPIVATAIGAFPERLATRPLTWVVDPAISTSGWLDVFAKVRETLGRGRRVPRGQRPSVPDAYTDYVRPAVSPRRDRLVDLRRPGRISVVAIPECFPNGTPTPCAYIRLLQPLDHPAVAAGVDIVLADVEEALRYRADLVVTQRHAVADPTAADALERHCRAGGAVLVYDLDDDLLNIPRAHPDAVELRPRARVVERMLRAADIVSVSTPALAAAVGPVRRDVRVVANGLDERLWADPPPASRNRHGPVRILFMGTATHDADFALIAPALQRLHETFGGRVAFDMIGVSARSDLPGWANRVSPSVAATLSYPGFVNWIVQQPDWDIGVAPLADNAFNRCKSAIKAMDYAALGLAVLASDVAAYRGSLADGVGGALVPNTRVAWFDALSHLVRHPAVREELRRSARAAFAKDCTLAAQAELRRKAWRLAPVARAKQGTRRRIPADA